MNHELELLKNNFDGDHVVTDVAETGASAALVSDPPRAINSLGDLTLLQVQETRHDSSSRLEPRDR